MVNCDKKITCNNYSLFIQLNNQNNCYIKLIDSIESFCECTELNFAELLFDYCQACCNMPCLPQAAFAVHKLRQPPKELMVARMKPTGEEKKPYTTFTTSNRTMEYSPVKYNSKLMKSIWGLYNRYSPHNIKKNNANEADLIIYDQQQFYIVAGYAISKKLEMAQKGEIWELPL